MTTAQKGKIKRKEEKRKEKKYFSVMYNFKEQQLPAFRNELVSENVN